MPVECLMPHCGKHFSTQSSLNRHKKNIHGLSSEKKAYASDANNYVCLEGCEISFKFNSDLRYHLTIDHNQGKFEEFTLTTFPSYEDFKTWLEKENKLLHVQYIKNTGIKTHGDKEKIYLNCIRSGMARLVTTDRKRAHRKQGSSKINCGCTSQIILSRNIRTDECIAKYYMHHYGHKNEPDQCLKMPKSNRQTIASKQILEEPPAKKLKNVKDNIDLDALDRSDDVPDVKKSFRVNVMEGCYHEVDWESVDIWVRNCRNNEENPVIFYKKQDSPCPNSVLNPKDFCLIFMNNIQRDLAGKFGNNIISIDSTHGLNAHFELTTLSVIDEFEQGFPIAFMFTNRKDTEVFKLFFQKIKETVGVITAKTFITDVTPLFYNAWHMVMAAVRRQLFCSWHLDRAWRNNLDKIADSETRKWVYKSLKHLQNICNSDKFHIALMNFKDTILNDELSKEFGSYFINNFFHNSHQWAYCYQQLPGVDTNMNLEEMHKVIKYEYPNAKKFKRLDETLHVLIKFLREKCLERLNKLVEGNDPSHTTKINTNHETTLNTTYLVKNVETDCWKVTSTENPYHEHMVKKKSDDVCCSIQCHICDICFHSYECSCNDYCIQAVLCKHIHYLCQHFSNDISTASAEVEHLAENIAAANSDDEDNLNLLKNQVLSSLSEILNEVEFNDYSESQYEFIQQHLNVIKSSIRNIDQVPETYQPSNNIQKQGNFHSTKRRNINSEKPSQKEIDVEKETISSSVLNFQNDHSYL